MGCGQQNDEYLPICVDPAAQRTAVKVEQSPHRKRYKASLQDAVPILKTIWSVPSWVSTHGAVPCRKDQREGTNRGKCPKPCWCPREIDCKKHIAKYLDRQRPRRDNWLCKRRPLNKVERHLTQNGEIADDLSQRRWKPDHREEVLQRKKPQCDQRKTENGEIGRPEPQDAVEQKGCRASCTESVPLIDDSCHQIPAQCIEREDRNAGRPRRPQRPKMRLRNDHCEDVASDFNHVIFYCSQPRPCEPEGELDRRLPVLFRRIELTAISRADGA